MMRALRNSLSSIIYPQQCRVCSSSVDELENGVACANCWSATHLFTGVEMLCAKCGAFLGDKAAPVAVHCHKCDEHHFDRAVAAGVYEKALAATILNLKTVPSMPAQLAAVLSERLAQANLAGEADVIIPVPLSRLRMQQRGFNQADVIAAAVSSGIGLPVDRSSLARTADTPMHRIGMDQKARELTTRRAFRVMRPRLVDGRNILLVDDVLTSGATTSEAARTLKKSGAAGVKVFTLARAVLH